MIEHFRFVKDNTSRVAKMTIPGPSMLHYRGGRKMMNMGVYPDMDAFYADLGAAYNKAVHAFYDAGCRYLQLDDISFAYLCDPEQREMLRQRGDDPERQPEIYAAHGPRGAQGQARRTCRSPCISAAAISARPSSPRAATSRSPRCCSTRCRSTAISWNGTPTAPAASSRCASCRRARRSCSASSPRRPARWRARTTSSAGSTRRRDIADLDQLCLSPQCGFASTEEGNILAEEEQWAKLRMIVEIAEEVWGVTQASRSQLAGVLSRTAGESARGPAGGPAT